ncbi:MAG: Asp-tRNA(Asn)/Glu-tRNA(Gln) amidotransferase subunit GatB [Hahellaceae bacterium]|nr:Asp-tRNA(Asn)/Glu-tRNA(Gln) amidotransferase subunit GatB [Hahellaceae bacterium]MCP5169020.1 Asp-tRNA(Asn)/Glu-tRNA(Gln) amidotransferase subunit GatB [Hahellaceae bacterium]
MQWETVIGLEVHVQLATKTKIFSGSSTAFGAEPNTQASAVDLAMPGMLPVLNEEALKMAIKFGLAIDAHINEKSVFERKNYFYPDLPKGYQTTQSELPIVGAGHIDIQLADGSSKRVRIHHAHLEEDAGKSLHEDFHGMSGIDLNRAGTPLIEIVSEPDMSNAEEAVAFARKLHTIVTSLGICDGEMSQGSMRFDVNVSVRPVGESKLGTRTETKNLNSFRFMERAIKLEVERQIDVLEDGGKINQETRLYDGDKDISRAMRSKEEANDYRYFPCPDLLPVLIDSSYIDAIRATLPELPDARKLRFVEQYGLSDYDAGILSADAGIAALFEATTAKSTDAKLSANWIMGEFSARLNSEEKTAKNSPINAEQLGQLILRIKDNSISSAGAKKVFDALWTEEGHDVDAIIDAKGLKQVSDTGALEKIVDEVLAGMTAQIEQYRATDEAKRKKLLGGFMGPLMKASKGQGNPKLFTEILVKKLDG